LSIALEQLQEPLALEEEQVQLEKVKQAVNRLKQEVKQLRNLVRECQPLQIKFDKERDQIPDSCTPPQKLITHFPINTSDKEIQSNLEQVSPLAQTSSEYNPCVIRIHEYATEVFEDPNIAWDWLKQPNRALGGAIPLQLLATNEGTEQVETILDRIDYGVYS
jgi:putative toxin-antitoxin system antitoxin component (TIGR02293 family)